MSPAERFGRLQLDLDLDGALGGTSPGPVLGPALGPVTGAADGSAEAGAEAGRSGRPDAGARPRPRAITASEIATVLGRPAPTEEQAAVIEAPLAPLLVVAGAGSGKTETMAARVVWLVANGLVEPEQVLGLTFTRKAAGELSERVRARLRALHRRGLCTDPQPVTVATYHSYAAAVLADHGLRLGIEPSCRVLGEAGSWQLVNDIVQHWDGDMQGVDSSPNSVVSAVLELASECAEHLVDPEEVDTMLADVVEHASELPARPGGSEPGRPAAPVRDVLLRLTARRRLVPLVRVYRRRKRELEVLDFADQVELAARLARDVPQVRAGERARFPVVLLDEYQDTSHAQLVLLTELFGRGHPVVAVGDPYQSIYGWRGACAGTLERFGTDFPRADGTPSDVLPLSTSWRNDRAVLAAANRLAVGLDTPAAPLPPDEPLPSPAPDPSAEPSSRTLGPRPGAGPGSVLVHWHTTVEAEAAAVADWVKQTWLPENRTNAPRPTAAVLCRTRSQFPAVEGALRARGLPVEVVGLGGLLHAPEIADLRAALEVLHDPGRGDCLLRLLTGPAWQLGARDLDALGCWSSQLLSRARPRRGTAPRNAPEATADAVDERSLVEAVDTLPPPDWSGPDGQTLSDTARRRLERLGQTLRELRSRTALPLPELVGQVERALLLDIEVAAVPGLDPASARARLDAFGEVAAGFAATGERAGLGAFLGWLCAAENQERGLAAPRSDGGGEAVQLLTIHAAKGLEWDRVAVVGLVEGTFPNGQGGRAPTTGSGWTGAGGALPYPLRGDAAGLPHWDLDRAGDQKELSAALTRFRAACGTHQVTEERRLAYVAVTRARTGLLLTGALWGEGSRPRDPSRFLAEVAQLVGTVEGLDSGVWARPGQSGDTNPAEALREPVPWPTDPLGERRREVERGAWTVGEALRALRANPSGTRRAPASPDPGHPGHPGHPEEPDEHEEPEEPDEPGGHGGHGGHDGHDEPDWAAEADLLLAERDADTRHDLQAALPAHLSASRVVALAQDPGALALRLRRPMPEPPSPRTRLGTAFHAWLERRFTAATLIDLDDLPGAADDGRDTELSALCERFLASEWAERTPVAVEVSVETPVAGIVLRGRIDAVFRGEGSASWEVVDWKTGAPARGAAARARAVQLAVYRLAWARLRGIPVSEVTAAFFYAATGRTVRPVDLLD
ncbi:MAG: ATP-dependent helicase UvrD/PcrA, partial [Actinomycetota bacterium]|nr:ATP-dependent helicase UvrD/PcrA [Actinomycetota bacterium]